MFGFQSRLDDLENQIRELKWMKSEKSELGYFLHQTHIHKEIGEIKKDIKLIMDYLGVEKKRIPPKHAKVILVEKEDK